KGKIFKIVKFKTMTDKKDKNGDLLPDADRLTSIGAFVRKTSLDEIPQLINVLKGDMSLIGPRPLLPQYLTLYSSFQARRHEVKPGITGWAQVNGRNAISWKQKFDFDVWYVDNLSVITDIKILYLTVLKVLKRDGISAKGEVTVGAFKGNK
ncbi:MAG TPA: lipid carrier--UDP-N-acetylgalactosaminyltransferase, partial [Sphingobacterium sp.]|nr:lipid carrier--UDP-N-acetylgalactosaminyltransferase [Sphingobacterium sp.]